MAANILFVRVTRGVLVDEVVGGLGRMASSVSYKMLCKVCEVRRKSGRSAQKIQPIECGQDDQGSDNLW